MHARGESSKMFNEAALQITVRHEEDVEEADRSSRQVAFNTSAVLLFGACGSSHINWRTSCSRLPTVVARRAALPRGRGRYGAG